jgi:hypothetical protein
MAGVNLFTQEVAPVQTTNTRGSVELFLNVFWYGPSAPSHAPPLLATALVPVPLTPMVLSQDRPVGERTLRLLRLLIEVLGYVQIRCRNWQTYSATSMDGAAFRALWKCLWFRIPAAAWPIVSAASATRFDEKCMLIFVGWQLSARSWIYADRLFRNLQG